MVLEKPDNKHVSKVFSLTGKVAAITGGARGIGLEISRGLAEAGADIAIIYSSTSYDAAGITASIASENNIRAECYRSDVTDAAGIEKTLQQIELDFGHLDIVVANAGIASYSAAEDYTPAQFSEVMSVNLDGAFYTAQAAARIFKKQGRGNIIFTASVSAILVNIPQKQAAYNASKAALVHLAKSLAVEWVDFARVNCVSPGFIATDMLATHPEEWRQKWFTLIPAQRLCDPYELKGAYVFCASDASSYMTGANLVIDGGYTLP
ncbi:Oxidoreductase [Venustampulla echinocandica]|uniref:Oxidoreductase n=1 Tax=Venustampulla echinocandica TaxID=2656787 RepID=A0A370TPH6_9HELO|nr:Oxidoreductase [Venustampulla echinocandica]RDL37431.1 Oxidoreductase [Venustampulla echinocandica]